MSLKFNTALNVYLFDENNIYGRKEKNWDIINTKSKTSRVFINNYMEGLIDIHRK